MPDHVENIPLHVGDFGLEQGAACLRIDRGATLDGITLGVPQLSEEDELQEVALARQGSGEEPIEDVPVDAVGAPRKVFLGEVALVQQRVEHRGVAQQEQDHAEAGVRKRGGQVGTLRLEVRCLEDPLSRPACHQVIDLGELRHGLLEAAEVRDGRPAACLEDPFQDAPRPSRQLKLLEALLPLGRRHGPRRVAQEADVLLTLQRAQGSHSHLR